MRRLVLEKVAVCFFNCEKTILKNNKIIHKKTVTELYILQHKQIHKKGFKVGFTK